MTETNPAGGTPAILQGDARWEEARRSLSEEIERDSRVALARREKHELRMAELLRMRRLTLRLALVVLPFTFLFLVPAQYVPDALEPFQHWTPTIGLAVSLCMLADTIIRVRRMRREDRQHKAGRAGRA